MVVVIQHMKNSARFWLQTRYLLSRICVTWIYHAFFCPCVKIKLPHYRHRQALMGSIPRQSAAPPPATFTPREDPWYSFLLETELPQGHGACGRIMSMKNSSDGIGNRTREQPTYSTVAQPTALLRTISLKRSVRRQPTLRILSHTTTTFSGKFN